MLLLADQPPITIHTMVLGTATNNNSKTAILQIPWWPHPSSSNDAMSAWTHGIDVSIFFSGFTRYIPTFFQGIWTHKEIQLDGNNLTEQRHLTFAYICLDDNVFIWLNLRHWKPCRH